MNRNLPPRGPNQPQNPNIPPSPPTIHDEIALSGLAARRHRRAEGIADRMQHKDELYLNLGNIAMQGNEQTEQEETLPERLMGVRMDRRMHKRIEAENNAYRTRRIHGIDQSRPVPSIRKAVIDSTAGRIPGSAMDGPQISVSGAIYENTKRVFVGADIPGYTGIKRAIERLKNRTAFLFGRKTAYEASVRKQEILVEKMKYGGKMHVQTRRQDRRRKESLELASEQPLLSAWRTQRRVRAEKRMQRIEQAQSRKEQRRHEREMRQLARQTQAQTEHVTTNTADEG